MKAQHEAALKQIKEAAMSIGHIASPLAVNDDQWNEVDSYASSIETLVDTILEEEDIIRINEEGGEAV